MTNRFAIQVVAAVVVLVFAAGIWLSGDSLDAGWLRFFSAAVTAALAVLFAWERWLWRLPAAQKFPRVPRCVHGTWRGILASMWIDPNTGAPPPSKTVYLVVRQTASTVHVTLLTDETTSRSSLAKVSETAGQATLDYLYLDGPRPSLRIRSPIHHGSGSLGLSGRPVKRMEGRYWTDRPSQGEVVFDQRRSATVEDLSAAIELFA